MIRKLIPKAVRRNWTSFLSWSVVATLYRRSEGKIARALEVLRFNSKLQIRTVVSLASTSVSGGCIRSLARTSYQDEDMEPRIPALHGAAVITICYLAPTPMSLGLPRAASSCISLTKPLTTHSLLSIRSALEAALPKGTVPDTTKSKLNSKAANSVNAAVLVPLCNVDDRPGVLLEVRGKLRTHSGEVRCVWYAV